MVVTDAGLLAIEIEPVAVKPVIPIRGPCDDQWQATDVNATFKDGILRKINGKPIC